MSEPTLKRRKSRRGDGPAKIALWGPPLLVFAAVIGAWYFVSLVIIGDEKNFQFPPPNEVFGVFGVEKTRTDIFSSFLSTAQVAQA